MLVCKMLTCKLVILSVIAVVLSYIYIRLTYFESKEKSTDHENVIAAWQSTIIKPSKQFGNVSIGINACVDLIIEGVELLQALDVKPAEKKEHWTISNLHELQEVFHHYFAQGFAAERFFSDGPNFESVVEVASNLRGAQWYIGGNAALMAQTIAQAFPDVQIHLSGPVGPRLKALLHPQILLNPGSLVTADEVHLILQYNANDTWGESTSPTATRFITSHDLSNSQVSPLEQFVVSVIETGPDLVVLSGLHMLDPQPSALWEDRIQKTAAGLRTVPRHIPVHLELASMANGDLLKDIIMKVLPQVDSLGLNEQELSFTSQIMGGPHNEIFEGEGQPEVAKVTDTMVWIMERFGRLGSSASRLTRIHFHSLTFHMVAVMPASWNNTPSAVAAGTRVASHMACDTDSLNENLTDIRIPHIFKLHDRAEPTTFDPSRPVISFTLRKLSFSFSPVLVCKKPLKTVGLGDAISATGLLYSGFS